MIEAAVTALLLAQWQTQGMRIVDEAVAKGYATQVNCTGSGVVCSTNGTVWTLNVTGGGGGGAPTDAKYLVLEPHTDLSAEVVVPTCGIGEHLTSNGTAITCTADAGAPSNATYLTMTASGGLSAEVVVPACSAGDALTSNGSAISCYTPSGGGGGSTSFVDGEIPSGTVNGVNTSFTVATAPSPATSLRVYVNGVRLRPTTDYTISGTTLATVGFAPQVGDWFYVDYRYGSATNFADAEIPAGTVNGSNPTFTLAHTATAGTVHVYLNGVRLRPTTDYSVSGATLTMSMIPQTGDWFYVDYRY